MLRRALVLALVVLAAPALASGFNPPAGANVAKVGAIDYAHWVGDFGRVDANVTDAGATLRFGLQNAGSATSMNESDVQRYQLVVALSSSDLALENATLNLTTDPRVSLVWVYAESRITPLASASGDATYAFNATLYSITSNGTVVVGSANGTGTLGVQGTLEVPAPPLWRTPLFLGAAGVGLVGIVAIGVAMRQRAIRRRMNEGPRRSQVMRELELEKELERARKQDPEQAVVIQQEIREQEQVREKRRELQILEAKRADALKTLDLLKKRHEAGGLSKLQYDNMAAKKQQDLARIDAEIAEMEREDRGAAA